MTPSYKREERSKGTMTESEPVRKEEPCGDTVFCRPQEVRMLNTNRNQAKNFEVTPAFLKQVEGMLMWIQNSLLESNGGRWRGGQDTMLHAAQPQHAPKLLQPVTPIFHNQTWQHFIFKADHCLWSGPAEQRPHRS